MRRNLYPLICAVFIFGFSYYCNGQNYITTIAGNGTPALFGDTGPATAAELNTPHCVFVDAAGNIYIGDYNNDVIRKINTMGIITTIAGIGSPGYTGDGGPATAAALHGPFSIVVDAPGNIYFSDFYNNVVRKVSTTGTMSTIVGTGTPGFLGDGFAATTAELNAPCGISFDGAGNLYIGDFNNQRVRKVNTSGIISTYAGNGTLGFIDNMPATACEFHNPNFVHATSSGDLYVTDNANQRIRFVNGTTGIMTTVVGNGGIGSAGDGFPATAAQLDFPGGINFDAAGNMYIAGDGNEKVRVVNTSGIISTYAGNGAAGYTGDNIAATSAELKTPVDVAFTLSGHLIIADQDNNRIREILPDYVPVFINGSSQSITVCENSVDDTLNSYLSIRDTDVGQTETWSLVTAPVNGTIYPSVPIGTALYTSTSNGGTLTIPTTLGDIFYQPNTGFSGIDTFYIRVSDSIASDTIKMIVTVNPAPSAITGNLHICTGSSSLLSDAISGGTWTSGSTSIATVGLTSGMVFASTATGIADIIYTTACGTAAATVTVSAVSPITPTTPVSICVGSSSNLADGASGGTWSSGNTIIATVTSGGQVFGASPGTATISYSIPSGCIATKVVTVFSSAITPHSPTICVGSTVTLVDGTSGGTWLSGGTAIATVTSGGTVAGASLGVVPISYVISGCIAVDTVTVSTGVGAITGSTILCSTSVINLSDTSSGGTWSSGHTAVATVDGSGAVTGVSGGTAVITYGASGCTATLVVTVAPSNPLTPATSSVCMGTTETFTEPALTGSLTGVWSNSNSSVATLNTTGIVTAVSPGTTIIDYTIYYSGSGIPICLYPATVNVTPNAGTITPTTPVSFCTGTTANLADTATGGVWSSSNTARATVTSLGVVTGVTAGTATIAYTLGTCSATKVVTVIAGAAAISPATATICAGTSTTLTETSTGGAWSSSNTGIATVAAGTVHGVNPGTATISYTLGTCSATATITVNTTPGAITPTTATSVCTGANTTLADGVTGGSWTSGNTAMATVSATGTVEGVSAGSVTISYGIGSCYVTKSVTIVAGPAAITASATTICTGTNVSLTDGTSGGTWSSSATGVATVSSTGTTYGVAAGTATISYHSGTCAATTTVTVITAPGAITPSSPVSFCAGSTTTLADAATGGVWTSSATGTATVSSTSGLVTGVAAGSVTITYTAGICAVTKVVTVSIGPAAILPASPTVCTGATINLSDANSGGTWSSSLTSTATVSSTGTVGGVSAGTVNIYYIIGSCVATSTVTVNAAPATGAISGTTSVCAGSTVLLTDGTTGGTWSSGNTAVATVSSTGTVRGITNGTVTISYSFTGSCGLLSATHIVTVSTTPSAGTITGASSLCAGSATPLSNTVTGGTWSASNSTATVNLTTGLLTGITPGTDTITYKVITPCGNATTTKVVTIGSFLAVGSITGATTICGGTTTVLSDPGTGGTWSSSNSSATITGAGTVTGAVTGGIDTISYSLTASCGTASATHVMTINPAPQAGSITGGAATVCIGTTATFTDTSSGGAWSAANTNASVAAGVVMGAAAGTDIISYTVTNSCGAAAATVNITVSATASAGTITGSATICPGSPATLSDAAGGGAWSSSNTAIATVDGSGTVTGLAAGTATISYTVTSSCGTDVALYPVTVSGTALTAGSIVGVSSLCTGSFSIFTDPTASGGTWSASNGNATITSGGVVTGVSLGLDTISYTVTNSCGTAVTSQIIGITGSLTAGTITGPGNVCTGSTITLSDAAGGGVWSATNTNAGINILGEVNGLFVGMDTILYTVTNSCGTAVASFVLNSGPPSAGTITGGGAGVCIGYPILYSSTIAGGTWSVSNTHATVSASGLVTGVTAGTVTLSYTVTTSCGTAVAIKALTIGASPGIAAITGASTLCAGSTITLADGTAGGSWSSSNSNATVVTGTVGGVSVGTSTISYSITYSCGLTYATKTVTVNPGSGISPITGLDSVCQGATVTLSDPTPGGAWSSGNTTNATVTGGVVTGISAGTAPISYTVTSAACGLISAVLTVNVEPTASAGIGPISSLSIVCIGSGITLVDPTPGGTWVASNGNAVVVGAGIIDGVSEGSVTISYVITNSCGTGAATKLLAVDTIPVVAPITGSGAISQCVGSTITLTDPTAGGVWTTSTTSVGTVGLSSGIVTGVSSGVTTITYTVTNAFGCPGSATTPDVVTTPTVTTGITGSAGVCVAASTTLSNATTGGAWSSGNTAIAVIDPASGTVTGVSAGSATISYTITNTCGTSTVTSTELVNPLPTVAAIGGAVTGCTGSAVTLTDATPGGTWSSSDGSIATIDPVTGSLTGVVAGTVTINYTVTNIYGCSLAASESILINAAPSVAAVTGTASECAGSTTMLGAGTAGGAWSSSNTAVAIVDGSGTVTGLTPGTATISYSITGATGCVGSSTVVDVVNAIPVESPVTGTLHVCAGAGTALGNSIPGGVWTSGNTAVAVADAAGGVITGVSGGTAEIYYTVSNSCGFSLDSASVLVLPAPPVDAITAAYTAICTGNTVSVSDGTGGGFWGSTNTAIATVSSSGTVTAVSAGIDTIYYSVTNSSGCSASAMLSIVVGGAMSATVAPNTTVTLCHGNTATMNVTASGVISYQWLRNGTAIAGATSSGYVTGTAGNYSVIISNGICSETLTGPAVVNPPTPVISFLPPNTLYTGTYTSYKWYKNGVLITGVSGNILTERGGGTYTVVVTDANGCTDTSAGYVFGGATGVNGVTGGQGVKVYPNPATSTLHIDAAEKVNVSILGIDGKQLLEQKDATDIDVSSLADGMYLIMVYDENNLLLQATKFVKEK